MRHETRVELLAMIEHLEKEVRQLKKKLMQGQLPKFEDITLPDEKKTKKKK